MSGYVSPYLANPTSVLTRPADTTAYAQNDLIASSATAGSVVVPSFNATRGTQMHGVITRVRLLSNVTTGWDATTFSVRLWKAAPTYTNGDNGAYAVATGAASWLATFAVTLAQASDGCYGAGVPTVGNGALFSLGVEGQILAYWDLQITNASGATPIASQTFTLIPEIIRQ